MTTRLILVGGFLGAGKTTLLWDAAQELVRRGYKVGLITNDQAPDLVDTSLLMRTGVGVSELSGSCFCCNFNGLISAMEKLKDSFAADILLAEPVGSCTDLSATIIQPLKDHLTGELLISPLTVLADPLKLQDIVVGGSAGLHDSAAYIYRKQLEEADLIAISKADLLYTCELEKLENQVNTIFPDRPVVCLSSESGSGLKDWLSIVLTSTEAGIRLAEVDYDIYAEGEAVLGWLNTRQNLVGPANWQELSLALMTRLQQRLQTAATAIGHIKLMVENGPESLILNLTGTEKSPKMRGEIVSGPQATMTLNARVETSPYELEEMVREIFADVMSGLTVIGESWNCLQPGRPDPTYRYAKIVA